MENKRAEESCATTEEGSEDAAPPISYFRLFRFAQGIEYFLLFIGILASWLTGISIPLLNILTGQIGYVFVTYDMRMKEEQCLVNGTDSINSTNNTGWKSDSSDVEYEVKYFGTAMVLIGVYQFIMNYVMVVCLNIAAERQVYRIRRLFLHSMLKQDIAWFDTHQTRGFQISSDLVKIQDGIGEKLGMFFFFLSTAILSILIALSYGWELTLIMLSGIPVAIITLIFIRKLQAVVSEDERAAYNSAGGIAEEVLAAIRTVVAFGGEAKEVERYENKLNHATTAGIRTGMLSSIAGAVVWFIIFACLALTFWYGVIQLFLVQRQTHNPTYTASTLIIIYFNVLMGAWYMGSSAPYLDTFNQARVSASAVFKIIDQKPSIDSSAKEGMKPAIINGDIEFDNVHFSYPSRPEVQILSGLSLKIKNGETVALVGESGCGKSTAIQLVQRFYDPAYGTVKLDGHDIKQLNLGWLRENIGVVGQEPVLFGTSIAENILYGKSTATMDDVKGSAKEANAHNFISKLPKNYDTYLGDQGTQLSGGQKQRVAIARAMIKNPKILLLDEATSALDVESEAVVQDALERARKGRTTIIIAHRLTTIKNADKIALFSKGKIEELGTHQELMEKKGHYYNFVITQSGGESEENACLTSRKMSVHRFKSKQKICKKESSISIRDNITYNTIDEECIHLSKSEVQTDEKPSPTFAKIFAHNKPEWKYILIGIVGSIGMGFSMPVYAILFGEMMGVLSFCDAAEITDYVEFLLTMMLITGALTAAANFLQTFMFTCSGEYLTRRLRKMTFSAMLKQEISWFDDPRNNVGSLCTRLSEDASNVQGATGSKIGNILHACCTLGAFVIISLFLCWKLALASIGTIPIILLSAYLHSKIIMGQSASEMNALEEANKVMVEAIFNIRTVVSLHKEDAFQEAYMEKLEAPHREALRKTHLRGAIFGLANALPFFSYAVSICFGGYLIVFDALKYKIVFQISELQMWGSFMVGQAFAFAPNTNRGIVSAARIFKILERKSLIDPSVGSGLRLNKDAEGRIDFKDVRFHYPTRPDVKILNGLNLTITPGQTIALVGSSGCGKSTCFQLLNRFYDPLIGTVTMDNVEIPHFNIRWLRQQFGIVSQEPTLFQRSIAENIAYGDNSREVAMHEIIDAATKSNIHTFISSLPKGYETLLGSHGAQLSGGQKQRIAIARAIVRNPKILLLDEATSALDTESEKVVQEALEAAQKGRTCITVAHRLSTIKNANQIAVIHRGQVEEIGTHQELLAKDGLYSKFYKIQSNH